MSENNRTRARHEANSVAVTLRKLGRNVLIGGAAVGTAIVGVEIAEGVYSTLAHPKAGVERIKDDCVQVPKVVQSGDTSAMLVGEVNGGLDTQTMLDAEQVVSDQGVDVGHQVGVPDLARCKNN